MWSMDELWICNPSAGHTPRKWNKSHCGKARLTVTQSGVVITEFIFAFVVAAGMSVLLFALTYTLLVVNVTQYVAFAVSRAHLASNESPEKQIEAGQKKFAALVQSGTPISRFFASSWFEIAQPDELIFRQGLSAEGTGGGSDFSGDLGGGDNNVYGRYQGVSIRFLPRIMNFQIPGLGASNPDGEDEAFETRVNALLIRESSAAECREFNLRRKDPAVWSGRLANPALQFKPESFFEAEDNGC